MSSELDIWKALKARCESFPDLRPMMFYPGDLQGVPECRHVEVSQILAAPPERRTVADGGSHYRRGTLQLIYCVPLKELNYEATRAYAGAWADHFQDGTRLRSADLCVKVVDYPEVGEGYREDGWWKTAIRVRWETAA